VYLFSCVSCHAQQDKENYEKLKNYLTDLSDTLDIDKYDCILFVSEHGCLTCVKSFSNTVQQYAFGKENTLIILNAKGHFFDVTPYREYGASNVISDFSSEFYRLKIASTSCIILLKEQKVERIIVINTQQLGEQLNLLQEQFQ
jgi:hypothetical protein